MSAHVQDPTKPRPPCPHGQLATNMIDGPWAGGIATCVCCRSTFGYLGEPKQLCPVCRPIAKQAA